MTRFLTAVGSSWESAVGLLHGLGISGIRVKGIGIATSKDKQDRIEANVKDNVKIEDI